jgi:hypothetical protein
MHIATRIGPVTREQLHQALSEDISGVDPGIDPRHIRTSWGSLITLYRNGHSTKWRVWFYADGTARITHPKTETLPEVDLRFELCDQLGVRDYIIWYIHKGWI